MSPRLPPPLLSLALRHWRATLIIRYRSAKRTGGAGRKQEGARNEESGSMLGQHIKIMASIGADAPYIPIRGKGLRLISIASRYPSPGWKTRAYTCTHALTHASARMRNTVDRVRSIRYFYITSTTSLSVPRFRLFEKERADSYSPFRCATLTFPPPASPVALPYLRFFGRYT